MLNMEERTLLGGARVRLLETSRRANIVPRGPVAMIQESLRTGGKVSNLIREVRSIEILKYFYHGM